MAAPVHTTARSAPAISLVMPCYNEEAIVAQTVRRFCSAFERAGIAMELIAVDNGSSDRTGEILQELAAEHAEIVVHRVAVNIGYGNGILSGLPLVHGCLGRSVPADGQVDAEDAVRLFEDAVASGQPVLAKARRRFRMDGPSAKGRIDRVQRCSSVRSGPGVDSLDINGLPKIMPREVVQRMQLTSPPVAPGSRDHDQGALPRRARTRVQRICPGMREAACHTSGPRRAGSS